MISTGIPKSLKDTVIRRTESQSQYFPEWKQGKEIFAAFNLLKQLEYALMHSIVNRSSATSDKNYGVLKRSVG